MKATIVSLLMLGLELTICLISPDWRVFNVQQSEYCFKPFLSRFNVSSLNHNTLHVGPLFSARFVKTITTPEHFTLNHAKFETSLLIAGIVLIITSAVILSIIECFDHQPVIARSRPWFHLANAIILTISLIVLVVGFYSLQHALHHAVNGAAAIGFFIGILFVVMLITHSGISFWLYIQSHSNDDSKKVIQ